jgi:hypothetical protein
MKLRKLHTLKNDNIGPKEQGVSNNGIAQGERGKKLFKIALDI